VFRAVDPHRVCDALGVDIAVVMGIGWTDEGLARDVNDYIVGRSVGQGTGFRV
jgi:hypothetical protein